jgi:hypothetical protein
MEWTLVSFAMSSSALVAHWWNRQPDSLYVISSNYVKAIVPLEPTQFLSDIRYSFTFVSRKKKDGLARAWWSLDCNVGMAYEFKVIFNFE